MMISAFPARILLISNRQNKRTPRHPSTQSVRPVDYTKRQSPGVHISSGNIAASPPTKKAAEK
jgi:hypothetical protein